MSNIMVVIGSVMFGVSTFILWLINFGFLVIPSWMFWNYYVHIMDYLITLENGFLIMGLMGLGLIWEGILCLRDSTVKETKQ